MKKKSNLKILKSPSSSSEIERRVEAILFSAEEPLDIESIKQKLNTNADIKKINSLLLRQLVEMQRGYKFKRTLYK